MSRYQLLRDDSGEPISVGDTITAPGPGGSTVDGVVTELETPDPEFGGCVHYTGPEGKPGHCSGESLGAQWYFDGELVRWDSSEADREAFESGRWTREDDESMERGRDLPMRNDAGEYLP